MTIDPAAEVARIEAERALLPKEERQLLEAADAPLLRIQLLYMLERAKKAEAAIERVQEDCTRLAPEQPDPVEQAVAYGEGWNAALDIVQRTLNAHYIAREKQ
ncbi:hypothetical protein [Streptomyces angustmyceticus]|uniref:hypothetical protein n=1 Tax=Streptomyces angustmyceticus TaxID=285578 RepID=UPI00344BDD1F